MVFVFSMRVSRRASRSCTVRLTSGNGCCRSVVDESAPRAVTRATHFSEARIAVRFMEADVRERRKENKMKPNWRNVMTKLYAIAALASTLMGGTMKAAAAGPAPTGIKNVVLVHGAFADGSGWEAVAKILEKDGK